MPSNSAEYMRKYRKDRKDRKEAVQPQLAELAETFDTGRRILHGEDLATLLAEAQRENARLADEVARLKKELAARPIVPATSGNVRLQGSSSFGYSRPAPKPGKK